MKYNFIEIHKKSDLIPQDKVRSPSFTQPRRLHTWLIAGASIAGSIKEISISPIQSKAVGLIAALRWQQLFHLERAILSRHPAVRIIRRFPYRN